MLGKTFLLLARELCINAPAIGIFFMSWLLSICVVVFAWLLDKNTYICVYIYIVLCAEYQSGNLKMKLESIQAEEHCWLWEPVLRYLRGFWELDASFFTNNFVAFPESSLGYTKTMSWCIIHLFVSTSLHRPITLQFHRDATFDKYLPNLLSVHLV